MLTGKKDKKQVAIWRTNKFDLYKISVRVPPSLTFHSQILSATVLEKKKKLLPHKGLE